MNQTATATITVGQPSRTSDGSRRAFIRHFVEMLLVMFAGMGVLGGLALLLFGAAGSSLSDQPGELRVMLMGVYMTLPMVAWMAYRGHAPARNVEMAASMMVPTAIAAALVGVGALGTDAGFAIQHMAMIPAMLGVMLWRYDEYSGSH